MAVADRPQTAIDEQIVESPPLEEALEQREKKNNSLRALRKQFKEADDKARALLSEFTIDDGEIIRVGRFRVSKSAVPSRSVAFETDPTSRLRIRTVDGD